MICRLSGVLLEKKPPFVWIDVHGVGYEIEVPMTTLYELPALGEPVVLMTHVSIREDAHQLFGFIKEQDRVLFRALIKINGVGPKLALSILSSMDAETFSHSIHAGDVGLLTSIPGIGKKTAERLLVEMKDRVDKLSIGHLSSMKSLNGSGVIERLASPVEDAIEALLALGYKLQDAQQRIQKASKHQPDASVEDLIKSGLQGGS